jgi:cytochrome c oxidase subunit 4
MKNVSTVRESILVYFALLILLGLTLGSAYLDLGGFNSVLNLGIALVKAGLVCVFFMHLKGSQNITKVFAAAGLLWLSIFFVLTLTDYFSRDSLPLPGGFPQTFRTNLDSGR